MNLCLCGTPLYSVSSVLNLLTLRPARHISFRKLPTILKNQSKCYTVAPSGSGGIGRRASLRSWWPKGRRGSSPFFRRNIFGKPTISRSRSLALEKVESIVHVQRCSKRQAACLKAARLAFLRYFLVHHFCQCCARRCTIRIWRRRGSRFAKRRLDLVD